MANEKWTVGTPIWADISTTDVEGASKFYGSLFGWTADMVPDPEAGGYGMLNLEGKSVGGIGPVQMPGQPPAWLPYIGVEDVEATLATVKENGGDPFFGPLDVFDTGRMGILRDPTGAVLGLWQPKSMAGFGLRDRPGGFAWFDLNTTDVEVAKAFYGAVFGWDSKTSGEGQAQYTEWKVGGQSIGGVVQIGLQAPAGIPPNWLVYFAVPDVDKGVSQIQELGGQAMMPGMDFPGGRFAVVQDPQGAVFGILTLKE
jgi:predicted enzyme related to lactoylglutathione lyase